MQNHPQSIYLHIPFCSKKCNYCSFTSFVAPQFMGTYIKAIVKEIKHFYKKTPLKTLYIGGGTPSLLNEKHFETILKLFKFEENAEITVELNPESTSLRLLSALKDFGVNRLSIGVQCFDNDTLEEIGRNHSAKEAIDKIYLCKEAGFKNISIDLIYGLPNQTLQDWKNTLNKALELDIEHISLYGLKIEEGSVYNIKKPKNLPNDDLQADMYELALKKLNNFNHYEISNFAKDENFVSRHNLTYWNEQEYFGFGVCASGFINESRYQNTTNFKKYINNPIEKKYEKLSPDAMLEETIFLGFRKTKGIDIEEINKKFNIDFDIKYKNIIKKYTESKHLEKTISGYKLTNSGVLVSNSILCDFLC